MDCVVIIANQYPEMLESDYQVKRIKVIGVKRPDKEYNASAMGVIECKGGGDKKVVMSREAEIMEREAKAQLEMSN
jgi:hypothetical protein